MNKHFGRFVRRHRLIRGYSLAEFAAACGLSAGYLSVIERGLQKPPSDEKIRAMAALLDYDPDNLMCLAGRLPPDIQDWVSRNSKTVANLLREFIKTQHQGE